MRKQFRYEVRENRARGRRPQAAGRCLQPTAYSLPPAAPAAWAVFLGLLLAVAPRLAAAKPLYVIANIRATDARNPIRTYDIGPNGRLTFRAEHTVPFRGWGPVGLALDARSGHLFVTYEMSDQIALLNPTTPEALDPLTAPGAKNLAGIVYDHGKERLYCMDRNTPTLYIYQWDPDTKGLTPVAGSPLPLAGAVAFGIALDELRGELYVGGPDPTVRVFDTADWRLRRTISVSRVAISVAVDPVRRYLYFGGSYPGTANRFLTQYDLITGQECQVQVDPEAVVMGLGVDLDTGFIYLTTGVNNADGGDDLLVFDPALNLLDTVEDIGDPTGLVIPNYPIPYNPLRLTKTIKTTFGAPQDGNDLPAVPIGAEFTYSICFDHNDLSVTDISLVDSLPAEAAFVRATGDGVYGQYERGTHTYTWRDPPRSAGPQMCLELVCRLEPNTPVGRVITNSVTLETRQTLPVTVAARAIAAAPQVYQPLGVTKTVLTPPAADVNTPALANPGSEVTYRIAFENPNTHAPVRNLWITDELPPQMTFVRATDDRTFGRYDPGLHTYTWHYPQMEPGERNTVDLVVRLSLDAAGGATITNTVTAKSDETPATRATADVQVTMYAPLSLEKTLAGGALLQLDDTGRTYIETGAMLTYALSFANPAANGTVTQVSLTDTLPRAVSFLDADGDGSVGFYDPTTHTYTWRYPSLEPGGAAAVNLVVRVNDRAAADTAIRNEAVIVARQTPATSAEAPVVTVFRRGEDPLTLQKTLVSGAVGAPDEQGRPCVEAGATITYALSFANPPRNRLVSQLALVDTLPPEVRFVRAEGEGGSGSYDPIEHTYTRYYGALAPGAEGRLHLVVQVHEKVPPNMVLTNAAVLTTRETPETQVRAEVIVREPPTPSTADVKGSMYLKPDHIFRSASPANVELMVVVHLPQGIGKEAIGTVPLRLTPGNGQATGQQIFGTSAQGKVLAFFDIKPILAATQGYGQFTLQVVGRLNDGRAFVCEAPIWILKFGGP